MLWSKLYAPLKKNVSSDIEAVSHQILLKSGMVQQSSSGVFNILPLGQMVLTKIARLVDDAMYAIGANKVSLSSIQPYDWWEKTGRDKAYGENLITLNDRHNRKMVLGPTHEECVCHMVVSDLKSYKQLPLIVYQIGNKFRDEFRPQYGLFRAREFLMKDGYSFNLDQDSLNETYNTIKSVYEYIFTNCDLKFNSVVAENGDMGGSESVEFISKSKTEKMGDIEIAHVFKLNDKYTKSFNISVLDSSGSQITPLMGCYGIGLSRLMVAVLEQNSDENGAVFNARISPFKFVVTPIKFDGKMKEQATWVASFLKEKGCDVLIDDRDVRPGVKFAEADMIGIPYRITVSDKLGDSFEVKERTAKREDAKTFSREEFIKYIDLISVKV